MEPQELSETERHKKGRQKAFLAAYEQVGSIARAAEAAKIGRTTHWAWMRTDPGVSQEVCGCSDCGERSLDR